MNDFSFLSLDSAFLNFLFEYFKLNVNQWDLRKNWNYKTKIIMNDSTIF
jgi:hypothetical protein